MGAQVSSITRNGRHEPFELQVARGQVALHYPIELFGYSTAVGSTALGPCWEGLTQSGGAYAYPSSAVQMTLVSTTTDTQNVLVMGLDANYNLLSETITLNGTTNVTTVNSYLRINGLYITNGINAGTITCKNNSVLYAQINIGIGQSQMSIYTVPKGYTFYLSYVQANASIGFTSSTYMTFAEYNKYNLPVLGDNYLGYPLGYSGNTNVLSQSPFVQIFNVPYSVPVTHESGTDIQFQMKASTGGPYTGSIFAGGVLIANADVGST